MRPRGESISVPSARYVGHWSRHSPQCTHREYNSHVGFSCGEKFEWRGSIPTGAVLKPGTSLSGRYSDRAPALPRACWQGWAVRRTTDWRDWKPSGRRCPKVEPEETRRRHRDKSPFQGPPAKLLLRRARPPHARPFRHPSIRASHIDSRSQSRTPLYLEERSRWLAERCGSATLVF